MKNTVSFKRLKRHHNLREWKIFHSLEIIELKLFNHLVILNPSDLKLITSTLLALSIYYIRSTCLKWFKMPKSHIVKLRHNLLKYGSLYYDQAIKLLRISLANPQFNVELSIIVSELLNKMSIYEFKTFNNSAIFKQGVISIFSRLIKYKILSKDVTIFLGFLDFASKTIHFPRYHHHILYELRQMVGLLTPFVTNDNILHLNHLRNYIQNVIDLFQNNSTFGDVIMYELLRNWLVNLPSGIQVMDHITTPIDLIILRLYHTTSVILNNLFPFVNYLFLTNFQGNFKLYHNPDYSVKQVLWNNEILKIIDNYCIRVSSFFLKRLNLLGIFIGSLNFEKLSLHDILNNINEVMIHKFNNTHIKFYNYIHLPHEVKGVRGFHGKYHYNEFHRKIFSYDPVLSYHLANIDHPTITRTRSTNDKYQTYRKLAYRNFVNDPNCDEIGAVLSYDYSVHDSMSVKEALNFTIDYTKGLDINDRDIKGLVKNPLNPFTNLIHYNIGNFNINNFEINFESIQVEEQDDHKFYDDINVNSSNLG